MLTEHNTIRSRAGQGQKSTTTNGLSSNFLSHSWKNQMTILADVHFLLSRSARQQLVAYTAGRMKKNRIKTLAGDRVTMEVSPYDLVFRHKDERAQSPSRPPQRQQFRRR
jgi:translation initiation factor IF-1